MKRFLREVEVVEVVEVVAEVAEEEVYDPMKRPLTPFGCQHRNQELFLVSKSS